MKHLIWTSMPDFDDWKDDLREQYPDEEGYNDDDRYDIMYDINADYYEDERANLDKELGRPIVQFGSLGLWHGRRYGYAWVRGTNLNDCLTGSVGECVTWYVENEEIKCEDIHHDGTNYYTYRVLKPEYSKEDFEEKAYYEEITASVEEMTEPLGHYVAEIYGWEDTEVETV